MTTDTDRLTETLAEALAAHGGEWGDGLREFYCDCGWMMDGDIGYEDGLPERTPPPESMGVGQREVAVVIRHRMHVAAALRPTIDALLTEQADRIAAAIEAHESYLDHLIGRHTAARIAREATR